MIDISALESAVINKGYSEEFADAKLCQDIILMMISKSRFNRTVTIKGGVVMSFLSKNIRRATIDIDLDLIKYPLSTLGVRTLIKELNGVEGIQIKIVGKIENLKHQDYKGKRIYVEIQDAFRNKLSSKIDIGVHKYFDLTQVEYCFDVSTSAESASLLINSPEQMVVEKIKSLLKFGALSTRYKDIYDICYLLDYVDKEKFMKTLDILIFSDKTLRVRNTEDIYERLDKTFKDKTYLKNINGSNKNWLNIDNFEVFSKVINYIKNL